MIAKSVGFVVWAAASSDLPFTLTSQLNLTLVDPDNRDDIDFAAHSARLARLDAGGALESLDDEVMLVTSRTLRLRRERPELFADDYRALNLPPGLLGFGRGDDVVVVVQQGQRRAFGDHQRHQAHTLGRMTVSKRPLAAAGSHPRARRQSTADVSARTPHRFRQARPQRELGGNRTGQRAPGAVRVAAADTRRFHPVAFAGSHHQQIDHRLARQMPSFEQHRPGTLLQHDIGRRRHVFWRM
mgnify:CR=1 FL=1